MLGENVVYLITLLLNLINAKGKKVVTVVVIMATKMTDVLIPCRHFCGIIIRKKL